MGSVPQISSGTYFKRLSIVPQTSSFWYGHHANLDLCKWHVDTIAKTRKNDQDHATKDASPYHTDKKKIQVEKRCSEQKKEGTDKHADEESKHPTDKETEEGSDQGSNKDQDSDVSFQDEIDEAIDSTEKEEDRIEYIKRSTKEAVVEHIAPAPSAHAEQSHVDVCIAPALALEYIAQAPVDECIAPEPAVSYASPARVMERAAPNFCRRLPRFDVAHH